MALPHLPSTLLTRSSSTIAISRQPSPLASRLPNTLHPSPQTPHTLFFSTSTLGLDLDLDLSFNLDTPSAVYVPETIQDVDTTAHTELQLSRTDPQRVGSTGTREMRMQERMRNANITQTTLVERERGGEGVTALPSPSTSASTRAKPKREGRKLTKPRPRRDNGEKQQRGRSCCAGFKAWVGRVWGRVVG
ncbi:hypothetical protein M011DRAFT_487969 [Sporormia fimetaria CBS 119925]|uniref:Uncharacterized protein n=1 Tax=Sporormia fimetaria CBS 119925 TaxID=1340428 RepID=A0A6A6V7R5_9PLEO|nr:hypothetical protein M011DRAFT_487969 [Sporormia fimetaria CBS 119925]